MSQLRMWDEDEEKNDPRPWKGAMRVDPRQVLRSDLPEPIRAVCDVIGMEATLRLVSHFGGEFLYVPKLEGAYRRLRNRSIREDFTGANHKELARKYDLSVMRIYDIVRKK